MAKVISQEQAALLSNLVYAVSTEGTNKGKFIFDNNEVKPVGSKATPTLHDYIYEKDSNGNQVFRKGVPIDIQVKVSKLTEKYGNVLDKFEV